MKTLGPNGMKALKILHILFGIMWIGGVMALVSIMLGSRPVGVEQINMAAQDHLIIDKWFLIPGGFGIVFTSLAYSVLTKWGFFKFRWVTVKWILTVLLVIIGKAYMGILIERNMALAEGLLTGIGSAERFYADVNHVVIAGIIQLIGFFVVLILSVVKPWNKRKSPTSAPESGSRKQA